MNPDFPKYSSRSGYFISRNMGIRQEFFQANGYFLTFGKKTGIKTDIGRSEKEKKETR
jgi:hypothetical protein